jgi:hypothetical protein
MDDLIARLRDAISEEGRLALSATAGAWTVQGEPGREIVCAPSCPTKEFPRGEQVANTRLFSGSRFPRPRANAEHIARQNPSRTFFRVTAEVGILKLHTPVWDHVEWPHAADDQGKNWVCPTCRPEDPTPWSPAFGEAGALPEGFVPGYTLAPCLTLVLLAESHEIEVPQ